MKFLCCSWKSWLSWGHIYAGNHRNITIFLTRPARASITTSNASPKLVLTSQHSFYTSLKQPRRVWEPPEPAWTTESLNLDTIISSKCPRNPMISARPLARSLTFFTRSQPSLYAVHFPILQYGCQDPAFQMHWLADSFNTQEHESGSNWTLSLRVFDREWGQSWCSCGESKSSLSCLRLTSVKRGVDCNQGFEKGGRSDFTRSPARVAWVIILFLCGVVAFTASLCSSRYPSSYCNDIFQIIVYSLCYCRYNVTVGC